MKATKQFDGVKNGEIYPTTFNPGDEIPPELEAAAIELKAVDAKPAVQKPAKPEA
ncbi:hypothetical protein ACFIQG_21345 [Comamonas odontotermitis]|uniref:hypothetical protein n=1 Tax=Comamonas odontotermitis TaxID=379895 RepID=UPI00366D9A01